MQFSLRSLYFLLITFGALPVWYNYWLVPFFLILIVCVAMALKGFSVEFGDQEM